MKRIVLFFLSVILTLTIFSFPASADDHVVLTIADTTERSGNRYDENLCMWQYLAEKLGVEIRYLYLTPQEYAAALSSGDLPDIVATTNNLSAILENDAALDAGPYLEEYAPNFLKGEIGLTVDVYRQLAGEEGGFYFFPARIGYNGVGYDNTTSSRGYVVRWDYYKELGYPPINNEDDYLKVLLQMHESHPFTEDGHPTYLYGTDNFSAYDTAFRSELNLDYWVAYKYQNNIFTNQIYDGYTDTAHSMWWAAMEWENKVYRAGKDSGSYDMDLFTQDLKQFEAKVARGQYLGLHSAKSNLYNARVAEDPDTLTGYASVPTAATNYYTNVYQLLGNGPGYMWFISQNSPRWKEALALFNYMADPDFVRELTLGKRGETWDYDENGVPRMNEYGQDQLNAYKAGSASPDNYFVRWGSFDRMPSNWPMLRDNTTHPDGYLVDFATISRDYMRSTMTNGIALDMCEHYGMELPTDAHYRAGGMDFRNDCGEAISSVITSLDREQLRILSSAEKILKDRSVELILAETDEEAAAIRENTVREIKDLGEPDVFRAYQEKWDAAAAVIVPRVLQAQKTNGIQPYTPDQYADRLTGQTEEEKP